MYQIGRYKAVQKSRQIEPSKFLSPMKAIDIAIYETASHTAQQN